MWPPRRAPRCPKGSSDGPKSSQDGPKSPQDDPKSTLRWQLWGFAAHTGPLQQYLWVSLALCDGIKITQGMAHQVAEWLVSALPISKKSPPIVVLLALASHACNRGRRQRRQP